MNIKKFFLVCINVNRHQLIMSDLKKKLSGYQPRKRKVAKEESEKNLLKKTPRIENFFAGSSGSASSSTNNKKAKNITFIFDT